MYPEGAVPFGQQNHQSTLMKKIIIALLLCGAFAASAQTTRWDIDDTHAKIGFTISHFGISETEGRFTKFKGTVLTDHPDFIGAKVDFTVDANSVNTDNEQRDNHLRSPDFFDATKYPQIIFKGKSLKQVSGNKYQLVGDLTMHGVTREVTLDALYRAEPYPRIPSEIPKLASKFPAY